MQNVSIRSEWVLFVYPNEGKTSVYYQIQALKVQLPSVVIKVCSYKHSFGLCIYSDHYSDLIVPGSFNSSSYHPLFWVQLLFQVNCHVNVSHLGRPWSYIGGLL